jgi:transposase, IS30 family
MGTQYSHLSISERAQIEVFVKLQCSLADIGRIIGRHRSTVLRELRRGHTLFSQYLAIFGQRYCDHGRKHAGQLRRKLGRDLRTPAWSSVKNGLRLGWSPQQIADRLRLDDWPEGCGKSPRLIISHETIYRAIYGLPASMQRKELVMQLRQSRAGRRKARRRSPRFVGLQDITPISMRPALVNLRLQAGHWEGDLIEGARSSSTVIITLVERVSRLVRLVKLNNATSQAMLNGVCHAMAALPATLRRSLTYDRGTEMARHKQLQAALGMKVYICDAYSPWQRGTNENTNGLLRQYLPKGSDFGQVSAARLARIEWLLNNRPRKILGYRTPQEVHALQLARCR